MIDTKAVTTAAVTTAKRESEDRTSIQELVRRRLSDGSSYCSYFRGITCDYHDGVLILGGRLPTFYLKQILQTRLKDLEGVSQIHNHVDVVSSSGLSSVRSG